MRAWRFLPCLWVWRVRRVDDGAGDEDAGENGDECENSVVLNAAFVLGLRASGVG